MRLADKSTHQGFFRANRPDGKGVRTLADGRVIIGDWNGDDLIGDASIYYPEGRKYLGGGVSDLRPHGGRQGLMLWDNAASTCAVIGVWREGKPDGEASATFQLHAMVETFTAEYRDGRPGTGTGIELHEDGTFFGGAFEKGIREGLGFEYDLRCVPHNGGMWEHGRLARRVEPPLPEQLTV